MPLAVSRQPPRGEILEAASTTAAATAAAGEEDLPSAALISRSEKDDPSGCTFETKVREWRVYLEDGWPVGPRRTHQNTAVGIDRIWRRDVVVVVGFDVVVVVGFGSDLVRRSPSCLQTKPI